jgi:hypothetical protein
MTFRRAKEVGFASKLSLRCGISLAGAVLIATVFGVPSASATLLGEAAGAARSVVPPAAGTSAPLLPSAAPPQTPVPTAPQVPIKVPTAPQAPPVKVPAVKGPETTPAPSHLVPAPSDGSANASSPGVDLSSVDRIASGAKKTAGTATSTSMEGVQQAGASARSGAGKGGSTSPGGPGETRPGIGARSVESAKVAPLRRLLAYVWPAIALGPAGKLLAALQARWEAATSLSVPNATRLLSGLTGITGVGGAAGLSKRSAISSPSPADSTDISLPGGGGMSLVIFIVSSAALMGWLIFSVRRELGSMYRWPH